MAPHLQNKRCSACRFGKCLSNGMDPRWVLTVEERQKLRLSRIEKLRRRKTDIQRMFDPDPKDLLALFTEDEMITVRTMVHHYSDVVSAVMFKDVVRDVHSEVAASSVVATVTAFDMTHIYRLIRFAYDVPEFANLQRANRELLIRSCIMDLRMLRSTYEYDFRRKCWASDLYPQVEMALYVNIMSTACLQKCETFSESVYKLHMDEPCVLLMMLVMLLTTDNREGLTEKNKIEALQERFLSILRKYVEWRYGSLSVSVVYPKLLVLMTEAQDMSVLCGEKHFWVDEAELDYFERKLGVLNPLSGYSLAKRDQLFVPASVDPYEVLDDSACTIDMLRRGAVFLCQAVGAKESAVQKNLGKLSPDSTDSFTLMIEDLDHEMTQESPPVCGTDESEVEFNDHQSPSSWSPEEFDLSWCNEALLSV